MILTKNEEVLPVVFTNRLAFGYLILFSQPEHWD